MFTLRDPLLELLQHTFKKFRNSHCMHQQRGASYPIQVSQCLPRYPLSLPHGPYAMYSTYLYFTDVLDLGNVVSIS